MKMEKTHLFEHTEILADETELKKVSLIDEGDRVGYDGLTFTYPERIKSKLLRCRSKVVVSVFVLVCFAILLILGVVAAAHVITKHSQSQQLESRMDIKLHLTSMGPSMRPNVSILTNEGSAEMIGSAMSENASLSNESSTIDGFSVASFSCFSPWFTRQTSCYLFSTDSKTWMDALESCKEVGGQLVQIEDSSENMYVRLYARTFFHDFWIGLTYQSKYNGWVWNRNTAPVMSSEYTSWVSGQNERIDGDCVALTKSSLYLWDIRHCNEKNRYICEKGT